MPTPFNEAREIQRLMTPRRKIKSLENLLLGVGLQNFQGVTEPQFFSVSELTLIYGPNSGGKSVLFDFLQCLRGNATTAGLPDFTRFRKGENRYHGPRTS